MIIIGIAGGIGHGKTTLAEDLIEIETKSLHLEMSVLISEVINAWQAETVDFPNVDDYQSINVWLSLLPPIIEQILHAEANPDDFSFTADDVSTQPELYDKLFTYLKQVQLKPELATTQIATENKSDYRAILQWLGGFVQVKLPPGVWFRELLRRARDAEKNGTKLCIISGVRFPADIDVIHEAGGKVIMVVRRLKSEQYENDLTERIRSQLSPDITVYNDAGLDELKTCSMQILSDLESGKIKSRYYAKVFPK